MTLRTQILTAASLLLPIGCGPSSSTGVGNPGVVSLAITSDDQPEPSQASAGAAGASDGGAGTDAGGADAGSAGADAGSAGADAGSAGADAGSAGADADAGAAGGDASLPAGSVSHALLVLGRIVFLPCDADAEPASVSGPFVLDLLAMQTVPAIPNVSVPAGGFCGIDAPLAPARAPAGLVGRSLFFDGVRADGTPFLLFANMVATLRVRAPAGVRWDGHADAALLWAFRPRRWLVPSELDAADTTPRDNLPPAIVIDLDRHPLLYLSVRARLAGRSTLYADLNHDGRLDLEDRNALLGIGSDNAD